MPVAHLVAVGGIGPDDPRFFEAFEAYEARLNSEQIFLANPAATESEVQIVQTWPIQGADAAIRIYDNLIAKVRHIEIEVGDQALLDKLIRIASETLPLERHDDLVYGWLGGALNQPNVLVKIALSGPRELSDSGLSAIVGGLDDPSPGVRCMAAYAIGLHGDPRLEGPLLQRLAKESDASAREIMERAVWMYEVVS